MRNLINFWGFMIVAKLNLMSGHKGWAIVMLAFGLFCMVVSIAENKIR